MQIEHCRKPTPTVKVTVNPISTLLNEEPINSFKSLVRAEQTTQAKNKRESLALIQKLTSSILFALIKSQQEQRAIPITDVEYKSEYECGQNDLHPN